MVSRDDYKPLKVEVKQEQKNLLAGFIAFSIAILILVIQGSIKATTLWGIIGLCFVAASIPVGIVAYILSFKVLNTERVPVVGERKTEGCTSLAFALTTVGFLCVLWEFADVLAGVMIVSLVLSFFYLSQAIRSWEVEVTSWEDREKVED